MNFQPFHANAATIKIAASTASTNMAINNNGAAPQALVSNLAAAWAFVTFGSSTVQATFPTTDTAQAGYLVPPNTALAVTPATNSTYMAAALSSGTGSVFATPGEGMT